MMVALTKEQFDKLTKDVPEDGFRTVVPLLMESFTNERGRTLDTLQVAALSVGLMEMSATIDNQITYIGELQKEVAEWQEKEAQMGQNQKSKLWKPR